MTENMKYLDRLFEKAFGSYNDWNDDDPVKKYSRKIGVTKGYHLD